MRGNGGQYAWNRTLPSTVNNTANGISFVPVRERKCADTIRTVLVPRAGHFHFPMLKCKYIFQIKFIEAILSHSDAKILSALTAQL